jgi:hypothetical protein
MALVVVTTSSEPRRDILFLLNLYLEPPVNRAARAIGMNSNPAIVGAGAAPTSPTGNLRVPGLC